MATGAEYFIPFGLRGLVEERFGGRIGLLGEERHHHRGQQSHRKAGDDLVNPRGLEAGQPQNIHRRTGHDAGHRAGEGKPPPEEAQENDAEGRTKDAPGVFHQRHDGAGVGVGGDEQRHHGDDHHDDPACPEHLLVGGVLAEDGLIDVAGKGGSRGQKLAVRRGHGRRENGREQNAGDQRREDPPHHGDEHQRGILHLAQEHPSCHARQDRHDEDDGRPGDADDAGLSQAPFRT